MNMNISRKRIVLLSYIAPILLLDKATVAQEIEDPCQGVRIYCPLEGSCNTSSGFGNRIHPITHQRKFHPGVDYPVPDGTPIRSAASGKVRHAIPNNATAGNFIVIDHNPVSVGGRMVPYSTRYLHMKNFSVKSGQEVSAGQSIGTSNDSGFSDGPHLHFEMKVETKDSKDIRIDPTRCYGPPVVSPPEVG